MIDYLVFMVFNYHENDFHAQCIDYKQQFGFRKYITDDNGSEISERRVVNRYKKKRQIL